MLKLKILFVFFLVLIGFNVGVAQNKPFPQALNFPNCIKPSNVTQAAMNTSVTTYYTYWKGKYLKNNLASLPGGYYVLGDITGDADGYNPLGSSEGQGYGMLITVMMAGYDANAKTIYDGLFKTARAFKSSQNPNLMGWVVADAASAQGHFDSATDGDMDIAYSLILAHYQWGSNGAINYLNEAKNMITNGLKASYVTNGYRLNLGDWDSKTSTNTRPSDWMLSHLKAFKDVTGDVVWDNVSTTTYGLISSLQANYSSATGLMPDFATGNPVKPAAPNFLESDNDGDYYYNACRTPLRFVMDFAHYGNASGKTAVNKIVTWAKTKTGGNPANFKAGYTLAGNDVAGNGYASAVFIAPIVAASTCDASHQAFLNSGWSSIINMKEGYFEDTYNLLCQLYITGNWWIPQNTSGQSPTVSITSPANNAIFTAPASITINAIAADADGSVSNVEFYNGTTLLGSDNTSPYSYTWTSVSGGTYTITAKATDNSGNATTSAAVTVVVSVPESPYGGTRAAIPGTIQAENYDLGGQGVAYNDVSAANEGGAYRTDAVDIEAIAAGGYNVGYVQAGEWMKYMVNVATTGIYKIDVSVAATAAGQSFTLDLDGTVIATVNVPNTGGWQTWQTVTIDNVSLTSGDKVLRFNATTGDFNFDKAVFTLAANLPPTVSITAPSNNATFTAPASVTINATANDTDGSISKVEFYNGTTLLNSDNATPFSYNWTGVAAGTYTITAKAYDNLNLSTTSTAITILVNNPNVPPTVSITAPTNNATFTAPASVTISATANDSDGSISKVEFYNGTTLLNSDNATPFSYNWTGVAAGTYTITAKAYDNLNLSTTSTAITIVVNNPNVAPTVTITAPTNNATFTAPASVTISATANDTDGSISKVEFYNGTTLLNSDNATPFSYNWTGVSAGTYTITAKAYDNLNLSTTSTAITIVVNNPNVAPTVTITAPTNNATFTAPASVTISATANDTDGSISKVEFYNGTTLLNSDNAAPYSYNWTGVSAGTYTITAKAYDNLNLSTTSTAITIVVNNPNVAPTVTITAPTNNATFTAPASVTINATANDTDGSISKVEFYIGTTLLNSDNATPFSHNWTGVSAGTYTITAKAYDNLNLSTTSTAITIVVNNPNVAPAVTITAPTNNATFTAPASVTISADANDTDGSISKVEFYNGTTLLNSDNVAPYSYNWTGVVAGTYTITAKAYDNLNLTATSKAITIVVNNPNGAPTVTITAPVNNTKFTAPASIAISADASDSDGSIVRVEFFYDGNLLGTVYSAPYNYSWTGVVAGTYVITAKAYDNSNASSTSAQVTIVVKNPNKAPVLTIASSATSPIEEGTPVIITATANDPDGSIAKMEIYDGNDKIGELTSEPYVFTLTNLTRGAHTIKVIATDNDGGTAISSPINITVTEVSGIATFESNEIQLKNFPNPFEASTEIEMTIVKSGKVRIIVYDNLGREAAILEDQQLSPGTYNFKLNASQLLPGTYLCKVMCENQFKNLLIVKQ